MISKIHSGFSSAKFLFLARKGVSHRGHRGQEIQRHAKTQGNFTQRRKEDAKAQCTPKGNYKNGIRINKRASLHEAVSAVSADFSGKIRAHLRGNSRKEVSHRGHKGQEIQRYARKGGSRNDAKKTQHTPGGVAHRVHKGQEAHKGATKNTTQRTPGVTIRNRHSNQ
jgi:hypothetical protein